MIVTSRDFTDLIMGNETVIFESFIHIIFCMELTDVDPIFSYLNSCEELFVTIFETYCGIFDDFFFRFHSSQTRDSGNELPRFEGAFFLILPPPASI